MKKLNDILTKLKFDKDADLVEAHDQIMEIFYNSTFFSPDVARKLLKIRDGLVDNDTEEAYHWLYLIVSPNVNKTSDEVWFELEEIAKQND